MDGNVINLGGYCGHGFRRQACPACRPVADTELEQAQTQITALNQQNMVMWYALQGIADGGCDPRGWAKEVLATLAKGTTSRGAA